MFRGSFARDAAAAVADADLRELPELVSKSLVRRADFGRFELHELLRQYAAERLAAEIAELAEARERHARLYVGIARRARADALLGERMMEARDELRVSSTTCAPPPSGPSTMERGRGREPYSRP